MTNIGGRNLMDRKSTRGVPERIKVTRDQNRMSGTKFSFDNFY